MVNRHDKVLDEREALCHEAIHHIQEQFRRTIQPYIDELTRIHNLRAPVFDVTIEQARAAGLL